MYGMFTTGITVLIIGIILISQSERRIGKSVVFVDDLGDDGMAGDEDGDEFDCKVSAETSDDMTSTRDGADASLLSSHSEGAPLSHGEDTLQ